MKLFTIFISGLIFGLGLAISGMTDPSRVVGFLDIFGNWDPALMFVMGGALTTYAIGILLFRKLRKNKGLFGTQIPKSESAPINKRLILGATTFGVGWALAGFCPGPAIANLAALKTSALLFIPAMLTGMLIAQKLFKADQA